jgi:ComF family protein
MATAILRLKYEDRADLAPRLGLAMLRAATTACVDGGVDLVVPVPLHPKRLVERGYNQAALLAATISQALGLRIVPRGLIRSRDTPRQAELDRQTRLTNLAGAFRAREPSMLRGARVLLIDDVKTTGSTLRACMVPLHEVGARLVRPLVLAQTPDE